jgi:hypothetical protein
MELFFKDPGDDDVDRILRQRRASLIAELDALKSSCKVVSSVSNHGLNACKRTMNVFAQCLYTQV